MILYVVQFSLWYHCNVIPFFSVVVVMIDQAMGSILILLLSTGDALLFAVYYLSISFLI